MFTRERHRRGVVYFGPYASAKKVRETLDVLNRVFQFRPCEGPQPGTPLGHPLPRLPHRALPGALRRIRVAGGVRDASSRASSQFLSGETRADPARARRARCSDAATRQAFEEAARYRNRLFADPPPRGAPGGGPSGHRHRRRHRARRPRRRRGRPGLPAPGRADGRPPRLHARERRRPGHGHPRRGLLPRVLRQPLRACRRSSSSRRTPATLGSARGGALEAARVAGGGAGGTARGEAPTAGARAAQRRARARERGARLAAEAAPPDRGARGAPRGAEPRERCRSGSSASTSRTSRTSRRSARWSSSRMRCRRRRTTGSSRSGTSSGQDDFAMMARGGLATVRAAPGRDGRRVRRELRRRSEPRRHRRWQGAALRSAGRDAGVRPAAGGGRLAREARGGGLRPRP